MSTLGSYAVVTSDKHGTILSANHNALQMFGYSAGELIGQKVNILMPAPYSGQHDTYLSRYHNSQKAHVIGSSRAVSGVNKQGELVELTISISEAETIRGTLYIAIFEKAKDRRVIMDIDETGKIYGLKGNLFLTLGYHKEELISRYIMTLFPPGESKEQVLQGIIKTTGKMRNAITVHKTKAEPINVSLHVSKARLRVRKQDGKVAELPGFRVIVTPVDNVEAMVTLSMNGAIISASSEFYLLFGYSKREVLGANISKLVKGELIDIFSKSMSSGIIRRNIIGLHKDGSIFTAEIEISQVVVSDDAESAGIDDKSFVCKIVRVSTKKEDKDIIPEGEYMGLYQYGKILGSGYFGKVRMAYHRITKQKVAIKTLRKKQYLSVNMEYPPREITVLKAVDHPNINRLYDTVVLDDRIHLILEFVDGRELCEIVETETVPEEVCRHLWRNILLAVDYLHDNGIVHRDLKLENIIIGRTGDVKVIDLGFGNFMLHDDHLLRTFCGSPDYAAPELFLGKAYNGKHADIWSLGVLLYAMLSGLLPFKNSHCIMKGDYKFPQSISPKAQDLIKKILTIKGNERISVKEMLQHPWTNIGYSGPPQQPPSLFSVPPDETILKKMQELGMNPSTVRNALARREINQFTTTYFLLQKKKIANEPHYNPASNTEESSGGSPKMRKRLRQTKNGEDCQLL